MAEEEKKTRSGGRIPRSRKNTVILVLAALVCVFAGLFIFSVASAKKGEAEAVYHSIDAGETLSAETASEAEPVQIDESTGGMSTKSTDGKNEFLYDYDGYVWIPVLEDVKKNPYDFSAFKKTDDGLIMYNDGEKTAKMGIDVSYHEGDIDWQKVAASGVKFVMLRAGYREMGAAGLLCEDPKFKEYMKGAKDAGLSVGVYFFSQAVNVEEAKEEAAYLLKLIDGYEITYPVSFDWEYISGKNARSDNVDGETMTSMAVAFCEAVKNAGYTPAVYFNQSQGLLKYDLSALKDYDFWLARYADQPGFYYTFDMWQYSAAGRIDGIAEEVDLNICFKDY